MYINYTSRNGALLMDARTGLTKRTAKVKILQIASKE